MEPHYILTPFFLDQPLPGLHSLAAPGWTVVDPSLPNGDTQTRMGVIYETLANEVADLVAARRLPVSITGDCCATIGVMAGLQRAGVQLYLTWFDAHGDFNTWDTTPSGFLGGMPLAMLAGLGEQTMPQAVGLEPIAPERILLTDARDLDPGEKVLVAESGIRHLPDPGRLVEIALPDLPVYVHFDSDIVNPLDSPAMSYLAPGGPRATELDSIFRAFRRRISPVAVSLSAWNPDMDGDGRSQLVSMSLLRTLLGS